MDSSESYAAQAEQWLGPEPQRGLGFALLAAAASVQEVGIVALRPATTEIRVGDPGVIAGNLEAIQEELARSGEILRGNRVGGGPVVEMDTTGIGWAAADLLRRHGFTVEARVPHRRVEEPVAGAGKPGEPLADHPGPDLARSGATVAAAVRHRVEARLPILVFGQRYVPAEPAPAYADHPVPPGSRLHDAADDRLWRDDGKCAVKSCPVQRPRVAGIGDGGLIPDALFRLLLDMVMISDPPPWAHPMDEQVKHWLDEEAAARGFDGGWVVAFHEFKVGA